MKLGNGLIGQIVIRDGRECYSIFRGMQLVAMFVYDI